MPCSRTIVRSRSHAIRLLEDLGNETSGDGTSTLTDVEAHSRLDSKSSVELALHLDVVTWLNHGVGSILLILWPGKGSWLISSADEQLWAVVVSETSVASTLLLGEDVHGGQESLVCLLRSWSGDNHSTVDFLTLDTTEEETGVVTSLGGLAGLVEGLDIGDLGLNGGALSDDLNLGITLEDTALDTSGNDRSATWNRENILDGHQEWLLELTLWGWDPLIDGSHELIDLGLSDLRAAALKSAKGGTHDNWGLITLETVGGEKLTHLHLDELQHLWVLKSIDLVDEDDNLLDTDLTGEEQVLAGLWHLSVGGGDDNDGSVHVGGTSNHVLDVIGVTWAVDVRVVTGVGGVLDVSGGDGNTTLALFWRLVDGAIVEKVSETLLGLTLGDGSGEGGLDMLESRASGMAMEVVRVSPFRDRRGQWYLSIELARAQQPLL